MRFRILGPLEVVNGDRAVALGRGKQRALLGLLLVHANEVVSRDRLIDELWGDNPPETAATALHGLVSQLRRTLDSGGDGSNGALRTKPPGYTLVVEPHELDAARFERLVSDGRAALADGKPDEAAEKLTEALSLWRGRPLADLEHHAFAQPEIARLEELRLAASEDLVEAELERGRHAEVIPQLEELVARHQHRERLRGQLMLALYRAQRQAEALEVYRATRRVLRDELGIEPSPDLARLHQAILQQDPELGAPPRGQQRAATARRRRYAPAIALGGVAALAAVIASAFAMRSSGPTVAPASLGIIDPGDNKVVASILGGRRPTALAVGADALWVAGAGPRGALFQVDPERRAVARTVPLGRGAVTDLAVGGGSLWAATGRGAIRVAPESGTVAARVDFRVFWHRARGGPIRANVPPPSLYRRDACWPEGRAAIGFAGGTAWVLCRNSALARIDADDRLRAIPYAGLGPVALARGPGGMWVANERDDTVVRLDPATSSVVDDVAVGDRPRALAVGEGAVWVANFGSDSVSRIAVGPGRLPAVTRTVEVGDGPVAIAAGEGAVWVANSDGTVSRIDPANRSVETIEIGRTPLEIAAGHGYVWVTVGPR